MHRFLTLVTAPLLIALFGLVAAGLSAAAAPAGTVLYAYANGGASTPTGCPQTSTASRQCTLA